jgi:hypothetical protein
MSSNVLTLITVRRPVKSAAQAPFWQVLLSGSPPESGGQKI